MYHRRGSSARLRLASGDFRGELESVSQLNATDREGGLYSHPYWQGE